MYRLPKKRTTYFRRQKRADPFYASAAWLAARKTRLAMDHYQCVSCRRAGYTVAAEEVDHIVPRVKAPELALTIENLQSLCKSCHSRKTAAEVLRSGAGEQRSRGAEE